MAGFRRMGVIAAFAAFSAWHIAWAADPDSFDARLTQIKGKVTIYYHDQGDQGVPAEAEMPLDAGDRVVTDDESSAEIGIEGDSVIELDAKSEFTVTSLDKKNTVFSLNLGSLLGKVKSLFADGGQMDIRTPTAVASVRGTEFGVEHGADGASRVGVFDEGKVSVAAAGVAGSVMLQPNQETSVAGGKPPEAPRALERFIARRERMRAVVLRAGGLRKIWKNLTPFQRRALRRRMFTRRRELMEKIREKRRENKRERRGRLRRREQ